MNAIEPTDVGTTPRKPFTDAQRLALFERHKGICCLCGQKIDGTKGFIDEHMRALGLGGSNDPENRGIAHPVCAAAKTHGPNGDIATIAKCKRAKKKLLGLKGKPTALSGPTRAEKDLIKEEQSKARRTEGKGDLPPRRILPGFESAGSWTR